MKVASPDLTAGALRAARLPHSRLLVRGLGIAEVAVGVSGIVLGTVVPAVLAAVLYAGFAWFVVNALRNRLPVSTCGCFGAAETPPRIDHVFVNVAAVLVMVLAVVYPIGPWGGITELAAWQAAAFIGFTGVSIYLLYGILAVLPMARPVQADHPLRVTSIGSSQ
jgi:Methylamine utilisation protein MauE